MTHQNSSFAHATFVPPGETLREWLEREDMTQADFARRTDLTPKHINQVVKGWVGISPDVALAFERVTSIPARYWTQLDANYQAAKQEEQESAELAASVDVLKSFPISELVARGVLARTNDKIAQLRDLLRFFAVANTRALEDVWMQPALYRKSNAFDADQGALAAWLRIAEVKASHLRVAPFDASACRDKIAEMRALSVLPAMQWLEPLQELCASVGIALVVVKEIKGCRVNGATRWLSPDRALIALSGRQNRNDIFWFTLFHELCHVLRHSKKETFVDVDNGNHAGLEEEADAFATRTLIPASASAQLAALATEAQVLAFADAIGVAPGIVVGRMQHDKRIPFSQWRHLITPLDFPDDQ